MARVLAIFALCLFVAVAYAADLRALNAQRAAQVVPPASKTGADGDLETASSWGGGWGPGFGYGGPGFGFGGPWGWGPWSYGYGFPYGGGWW